MNSTVDPLRLRRLLRDQRVSQTALAGRVGVTQGTIAKLANGGSAGSKHLHKIARALGTTTAYLTGDIDDPSADASVQLSEEDMAAQLDMVEVKQIDLAYGLGGQYLDVQAVVEETVWFPANFVRQFTKSDPEHLRFSRGDGDSMAPTIGHHDIVLFDMSEQRITRQDAIWVVALADIGMIKRVRAMPDGSYELHSDNPLISPQYAADGEMHVIGRVVASIRGM